MSAIPVFCYHYFGIDRTIQPGIKKEDLAYITPVSEFELAIENLRRMGYEFVVMNSAPSATGKCCAITIDDAHHSVVRFAAPVLKKMNVPATLFVVPTWVGRDGYMNWQEINELASAGWLIGSHGLTHRLLTSLSDTDALHELLESRKALQNNVTANGSAQIPPLALPMGGYSERIERLARQIGYEYIVTSRYGWWDGKAQKAIPRLVLKEPYDRADALNELFRLWSRMRIELWLRSFVKWGRDLTSEWKRERF